MKGVFKNSDGTVKLGMTLAFTSVITFVLFFFFLRGFLVFDTSSSSNNVVIEGKNNKASTTTISLCNDCSFSFISSSITAVTNGSIDINDIMNLNKINIQSIRFSVDNTALAQVSQSGNTEIVSTGGQSGIINLTATFQDKSESVQINIDGNASVYYVFEKEYYYLDLLKSETVKLNSYPYGSNTNDVTYSVSNKKTLSVDKKGKVTARKQIGSYQLIATGANGASATTNIIVVNNKITTKILEGDTYKEYDEYHVSESKDLSLNITFEDNNNDEYTGASIASDIQNSGGVSSSVSYVGSGKSYKSYEFTIHVDVSGSGYSLIRFSLPDGSIKYLKLIN